MLITILPHDGMQGLLQYPIETYLNHKAREISFALDLFCICLIVVKFSTQHVV